MRGFLIVWISLTLAAAGFAQSRGVSGGGARSFGGGIVSGIVRGIFTGGGFNTGGGSNRGFGNSNRGFVGGGRFYGGGFNGGYGYGVGLPGFYAPNYYDPNYYAAYNYGYPPYGYQPYGYYAAPLARGFEPRAGRGRRLGRR
jgi:hypothetical protein